MDPLVTNPFAVLTFIAAPAILTNASSVIALGTSNRFARAVDRARALTAELRAEGCHHAEQARRRVRLLRVAQRRAHLLVRALTMFYLSVGSFAGASFTSLIGAAFVISQHDVPRAAAMIVAFGCGLLGVGGLVSGSALLVYETRLTLAILREEADVAIASLPDDLTGPAAPARG